MDPNDARSVAIAALCSAGVAEVRPDDRAAGQPGGPSSAWGSAFKVMVTRDILSRHLGPLPLVNQRGRAVAVGALALVVGGLACPYAD